MKAATLLALTVATVTVGEAACPYSRVIQFSDHNWCVKTTTGRVGPGPNFFSDSSDNVWVDLEGRLHLKITKSDGRWKCAEVIGDASPGYGTYRFHLDSPVEALDRNVVLGLFTWNDQADYHHREIDIEFSRWGSATNQNAQFVIQPYTKPANIMRWNEPAGLAPSIHAFTWTPTKVDFLSVRGLDPAPVKPADVIKRWSYEVAAGVPKAGGENPRINLWLNEGKAPTNNEGVEVVIKRFEFVAPH